MISHPLLRMLPPSPSVHSKGIVKGPSSLRVRREGGTLSGGPGSSHPQPPMPKGFRFLQRTSRTDPIWLLPEPGRILKWQRVEQSQSVLDLSFHKVHQSLSVLQFPNSNSNSQKYYKALAYFTAVETEAYRGLSDLPEAWVRTQTQVSLLLWRRNFPALLLSQTWI